MRPWQLLTLLAMLTAMSPIMSPIMSPVCAYADGAVAIRQGRHGNTGRLVFAFAGTETFRSQRSGSTLTIEFTPAQPIASFAVTVPGIKTFQGGAGIVHLQLADGATAHIYRLGNRVVLDTSPRQTRHAAKHADKIPRPAVTSGAPPATQAALKSPALTPPPLPAVSLAAPAMPLAPAPPALAPPALAVTTPNTTLAPGTFTQATINFATQPGAAAFRRGNQAILVFDTPEVPDLTALGASPIFAGAGLVSLQNAQVVSIPLPPTEALAMTPVPGGWKVAAIPAIEPVPAPPQISVSVVEFPMQSANQSIIIADPLTGGDLLVGTVAQNTDAADFTQSGPGYAVLPAWLGVVIVPLADNLGLNASLKGFELVSDAANGMPLGALPPAAVMAASPAIAGQALSLPRGSTADLWKRLVADQRAAALLPALGRLGAQVTLAQDMLALGMGPEALGVLDTAVLENPAAQDNGQIAAMRAVADVLAHHSQPGDFTAPGIVFGTELSFWRAAAALDQHQTGQASSGIISGIIAGLPIFETYPAALRNTLTAEIAEALADNGRLQAASQLVTSDPHNKLLDLARAKILENPRLENQSQAALALAAYQALAQSPDNRVSAIANARVVELQHAAGRLNDAQAADALDAQLFNWRDPEHERHMRMRIAELRGGAGQWPQAFAMLQSARTRFAVHQLDIDAMRNASFLKMLSGKTFAQLSPIEAVGVLQQNQDLIPASGSPQVISLLAQRLDELDLPGAAAPMLSHLIQTVPPGFARARLGATLAQVDLDAGSPVAALADLSQTVADNLPPALTAQRNLLAAKAQAAAGNAVAAVNTLSPLPTLDAPAAADPQTLVTQAQIAEQSSQWPQAEQALSALVGQSVPAAGPIGAVQENLLLRLATAASHNSDAATLAALSTQYGPRVGNDAAGQMFQTLTTPPLTGDQGLTQALHEIALLQALPAMLNAVTAPPKTPLPASSASH